MILLFCTLLLSAAVGTEIGINSADLGAKMSPHGGGNTGKAFSPKLSKVWGPGLDPAFFLPVRYFYLQAVDTNGQNFTVSVGKSYFPPVLQMSSVLWEAITIAIDIHTLQLISSNQSSLLLLVILARLLSDIYIYVCAKPNPKHIFLKALYVTIFMKFNIVSTFKMFHWSNSSYLPLRCLIEVIVHIYLYVHLL